jgi:hypothetical protein
MEAIKMPRFQGQLPDAIKISTGYNDGARLVDQSEVDFFVQDAMTFSSISLDQESKVNSETTAFNLTLQLPESRMPFMPSDILRVSLPADELFSIDADQFGCKINGLAFDCDFNTKTKMILFKSLDAIDKVFNEWTVLINGLHNKATTRPSSAGLLISIVDEKERILISQDVSTAPLLLETDQASTLGRLTLVQSSTTPLSKSDYTFKFALTQTTPQIED